MAENEEPKKRGRPAKFANERTRGSLTVRLRDEVRNALEQSAIKYGRSLSEEIETRMEISLASIQQIKYEWGDDLFRIASAMAASLSHIEGQTGKSWFEDAETQNLFQLTAVEIIRNYKDMLDRNGRLIPKGDFASKSPTELAQMFAAAGGMAPPRPKRPASELVIVDED
jgi:hypothetical protein